MVAVARLLSKIVGFNPLKLVRRALRMRTLVQSAGAIAGEAHKIKATVVVSPWFDTPVPDFSIAFGLAMASGGADVTFVIDDMRFDERRLRYACILRSLLWVLGNPPKKYAVQRLSSFSGPLAISDQDVASIRRMAELDAVWTLRGEMISEGRKKLVGRYIDRLTSSLSAIRPYLNENRADVLFVPGGVYGNAGVWFQEARSQGIRVATNDSGGDGISMFAVNGLACQHGDIPLAHAMLVQSAGENTAEGRFVCEIVEEEIGNRRQGKDTYSYQVQRGSGSVTGFSHNSVLIALNSSWDGAALGLHRAFDSTFQWLFETVDYLLSETDTTVIVRQHPAERFSFSRSRDDYKAALESRFGQTDRIKFIAAADPVNSYDLLDIVRGVIVYASTFGVEAAMLGKPVVTESAAYYSKLGFVWAAETRDAYNGLLKKLAVGELRVTADMKRGAEYCYYLAQCRTLLCSPVSPYRFESWSHVDVHDIAGDANLRLAVDAIVDNVPVSVLLHKRCYAGYS
jgi:hypothetical protein